VTAAPRILVVEDDDDLRSMLVEVLAAHRFEVVEARNGRHALELLQHNGLPAAILLDHVMPVMDAMGFLEERARLPRLARVPVVLLTALDPSKIEWPAGIDQPAVHAKPIDVDALLSTLRRLCA
jgi:CheY-like chemotaxis protein